MRTKMTSTAYDKISSIFVPVVIFLATVTFTAWGIAGALDAIPEPTSSGDGESMHAMTPFMTAFVFGCSVLVIACPCALGLATPTAVMVGSAVATRQGVLVKGGDVLETARYDELMMTPLRG